VSFAIDQTFWAFVLLALLLLVGRVLLEVLPWLKRLSLPSSVVGGIAILLLGPAVLGRLTGDSGPLANGAFPEETVAVWAELPGLLINVVFAALLMGRSIPDLRTMWHRAGPQICFGQTLAWGQYVVGLSVTLLVLTPLYDIPPIAGALIEIGFEGGHGTASGMGPVFEQAGWAAGQELALGLATIGLVGGVVLGTATIRWATHRGILSAPTEAAASAAELPPSNVELAELRQERQSERQPTDPLALNVGLIGSAIALGWLGLSALRALESATWGAGEGGVRVLAQVPLFPMAMLGGVAVQALLEAMGKSEWVSVRLMQRISGTALDLTIAAALGTLSLQAIGANLVPFLLLAAAGTLWCGLASLVLAPRIIPQGWFERGVGDFGQSMGVTVTGLLLMRVADPGQETGALESFGYKQLFFEPIVGGGLFTGASIGLILAFDATTILAFTTGLTAFWMGLGLLAFGRSARHARAAERKTAHSVTAEGR